MVGALRFQHLRAVYHVMVSGDRGKMVFQTDDVGMVLLKRLEGTVFSMKTISVAVILLFFTPLSWGTDWIAKRLSMGHPGSVSKRVSNLKRARELENTNREIGENVTMRGLNPGRLRRCASLS
jgi:hypothetical protein